MVKFESEDKDAHAKVFNVDQPENDALSWDWLCPNPRCVAKVIRENYVSRYYTCTVESEKISDRVDHIVTCVQNEENSPVFELILNKLRTVAEDQTQTSEGTDGMAGTEMDAKTDKELKAVFHINGETGMRYKFLTYNDDELTWSVEWQDFKINQGIADEVFDVSAKD
jgi:hypothetical protein